MYYRFLLLVTHAGIMSEEGAEEIVESWPFLLNYTRVTTENLSIESQ